MALLVGLAAGCGRREVAPEAAAAGATNAAAAKAAAAEEMVWGEPMPPLPSEAEAATNKQAWLTLEMRDNAGKIAVLVRQREERVQALLDSDPELKRLRLEADAVRRRYDERLAGHKELAVLDGRIEQLNRRQGQLSAMRRRLERFEEEGSVQ